jgi:hypothetical protein
MFKNCLGLVLLGLAWFSMGQAAAQSPRFVAEVNPPQVMEGDYFQVSFMLYDASGAGFTPPSFGDFAIVGGPSEQSSFQYINGKMSRSVGYSYYLSPRRTGTLTIGPATIRAAGKTLKSNSVQIEVLPAGSKKQANTASKAELMVRAVLSKNEIYVGEQVSLEYKMYYNADIEDFQVTAQPSFQDIFVTPIDLGSPSPAAESINGKAYSVVKIRKFLLVPLKSGNIQLDPMRVEANLVENSGQRRSFFFDDISLIPVNTASQALSIQVKPLPPAPAGFSGAVGRYKASTSVDRTQLSTDDAMTVVLTVTGRGDIKQLQAPLLNLPTDSFDIYEPKVTEKNLNDGDELVGIKSFEYVVMPRYPGNYTLNPKFIYFDTERGAYVSIDSFKQVISVSQGTRVVGPNDNGQDTIGQADKQLVLSGLMPLGPGPGIGFAGSVGFVLALIALLALIPAMLYYRQRVDAKLNRDPAEQRKEVAASEASKRLQHAKQLAAQGQHKPFYEEVQRALWRYFADKLGLQAGSISKQELVQELVSKGATARQAQGLQDILSTCEMALYAGLNQGNMDKILNDSAQLIDEFEKIKPAG